MRKKYLNMLICTLAATMVLQTNSAAAQTRDGMVNRAEILEEAEVQEQERYDAKPEQDASREPENDTVVIRAGETDTTTIRIGGRTIRIIDKNDGTDVSILDREPRREEKDRRVRPFKGNWRGLEIGLNNYVNSDFSVSLDPGEDFMELHAARSWNINLNFLQYDLTLRENNIGLVTGLGLERNTYRFSNNVNITKQDGVIVPVDYDQAGIRLDRTLLRTYYLAVPLLIEFQSNHPRRSQRAYFSTGIIGGLNIGSNTRVVYRDNSGRNRDRVRDDFYLSPFRYGLTARAGFRSLNLYANYYPTGLFQDNKGPELYPVSVGFSILGF
jgi:hypothetical protein